MQFIQNRCPKIEHSRLSGLLGLAGFIQDRYLPAAHLIASPCPDTRWGVCEISAYRNLEHSCRQPPDAAAGARITPIYQSTAFTFDDGDHAASLYNLQEPAIFMADYPTRQPPHWNKGWLHWMMRWAPVVWRLVMPPSWLHYIP